MVAGIVLGIIRRANGTTRLNVEAGEGVLDEETIEVRETNGPIIKVGDYVWENAGQIMVMPKENAARQ